MMQVIFTCTILLIVSEDISNREIIYSLNDGVKETEDSFVFDVMDSRPNTLYDIEFHITWSYVTLGLQTVNVTEEHGVIEVPVHRAGSLSQVDANSI